KEAISSYDALLVSDGTVVDAETIAAGRQLKVIGRVGMGADNIDIAKATSQGILVLDAPEGYVISEVEHTMLLMLELARHVSFSNKNLIDDKLQEGKFKGVELYKKILGLIGFNSTGSEVSSRARAFGMNVMVCDPYLSVEQAEKLGVVPASLEQVLAQADFISIHLSGDLAGQCILGAKELARIKKGVRLISCGYAGLVDAEALCQAILNGRVAGAALSMFDKERPAGNPLWQLKEVIATPHFGAFTKETQENVILQVAEQVVQVLKGKPTHLAINVSVLPPELSVEVQPFIPLMKILGSFYMQVFGGRVKEIEITYSGEIANYPVTTLTTSFLVGFLRIMVSSSVNFVSARLTARRRGIKVREATSKNTSGFNNLVTVKVTTTEQTFTIGGTIFEGNDIRIVQIGDYSTWVIPSRYMLVSRHLDQPGVVGKVGTVLADYGIDLTGMQLGRKDVGGEAFMVLHVDKPIPYKILQELERLEPIFSIRFVENK
ncbi:MAG: phosphoglycerate dehydrogenase, partial [Firmicutes bacterium]|nr:phosphoglycerate dehydrogenase [Bacillota bacterium]